MSPCRLSRLVANYIVVYDFRSSAADAIHPSNPLHLIGCFERFRDTFLLHSLQSHTEFILIPPKPLGVKNQGASMDVIILLSKQVVEARKPLILLGF